MNDHPLPDPYGVLTEPATLEIQRVLPGPVERVWAYLTESELRCQWLAAGQMEMKVGAPVELVWRNDELSSTGRQRPDGFPQEQRMHSRITELDPPHKLAITWDGGGEVSFELKPEGAKVLLTVIHRRLANRDVTIMVGAGWHMHLDILAALVAARKPDPFWDGWIRLRAEYDQRLSA